MIAPINSFSIGFENLSVGMTKRSMTMDFTDIVSALKELDYTFDSFGISAALPLVDQYGEKSVEDVIHSNCNQEFLDRINPNNSLTVQENLPDLATEWWEHAALNK
ncbi:hypothetical protein ACFOLA_02200 [Salinicoccus hispanicus]|uniref:hypothetical protein n=1 Tax=Salinicoccus hispanicus TaxID=157225 RepID=UPI001B87B7DC|nr:hypothetical protein [Salinicoccus hispanicus]